MFLAKEKALYKNMNMMKQQNQMFVGFYWAASEYEAQIKQTIVGDGNSTTKIQPYDQHFIPRPTFFKPNEFTEIWSTIVDTYGVPSYQEASPVPVSIVTFPFFFGIMFGDMGHGSILFFVAAYLTLFNNQLKGGLLNDFL